MKGIRIDLITCDEGFWWGCDPVPVFLRVIAHLPSAGAQGTCDALGPIRRNQASQYR